MTTRLNNSAVVPGAQEALQALGKAIGTAARRSGLPQSTLNLVEVRASQINGCAVCLDMHSRAAKKAGETDERLFTLAGWRDTPYFSDAERAALALTEAGTRIADRGQVPDDVYDEAAKHYDEQALAAIVFAIAAINAWNRLNVITGQVTGEWVQQWVA